MTERIKKQFELVKKQADKADKFFTMMNSCQKHYKISLF